MKIFFTSALIKGMFELRKTEYIKSYNVLKDYISKENIFITECFLNEQNTFLNSFGDNVFYVSENNTANNKGVREASSLIKFIQLIKDKVDDDELIIKQTGRYCFLSNYFIEDIKKNADCDVFVRSGTGAQFFFGCFAIKFKWFKIFLKNLDLQFMEQNNSNIEWQFYKFIYDNKLKAKIYDKIDMVANINNDGDTYW